MFVWPAPAAVLFEDGFETGLIGPSWAITRTEDGRATVSSNYLPASGNWHLILDDSVNDAIYSVVEATLRVDLSQKRNVVLSFQAKSLGNEPDYRYGGSGERDFDGLSMSTDGGVTWSSLEGLWWLGSDWESFSIPLDYRGYDDGFGFGSDVRIRFSEYDNASVPLDGIAIDNVVITGDEDQRATVEMQSSALEGSGPYIGYVLLAFPPTNALTLTFSTSPAGQLVLPGSVVIEPGQTSASFNYSIADDHLTNLRRDVTVRAEANGVNSIPFHLTIIDDDTPRITVQLPPTLLEGDYYNHSALVTLDRPATVGTYIDLLDPQGRVSAYASIPAGTTEASFTLYVYENSTIEGDVDVTVIAEFDGKLVATNHVLVLDNERPELALMLPAAIQEGQMGVGSVRLGGTLRTNIQVALTSANPGALAVPAFVNIPAGNISAEFSLTATDNNLADGRRTAAVVAAAPGFVGTNGVVTVRDNEWVRFSFGALSNIVDAQTPLLISVSAADLDGNPISGATGTVHLSLLLPGGDSLPVEPPTATIAGDGTWEGTVTFPSVIASPLRLMATNELGYSGISAAFDLMRTVKLQGSDLVWDSRRHLCYVSVGAGIDGTNANQILAIDPDSTNIVKRVFVGQNPGRLALTSGGEYLYAALSANGTIAKIDAETLSVLSTFPLRLAGSTTTSYPLDICAVAGQPDALVVSFRSDSQYGISVYVNGIARSNVVNTSYRSSLLQPSADPEVFFSRVDDGQLQKVGLNASGVSVLASGYSLVSYSTDIQSDGNRVFSSEGQQVDGEHMLRLGNFPTRGPVRPDLGANRVYFIERADDYFHSWDGYEYDKISAYDPATCSRITTATFSTRVMSPTRFIRWETNGLALLERSNVVFIRSSQLVPSETPANLVLKIDATPRPAPAIAPITYTLVLSNQGPNVARAAVIQSTVFPGQTLQSVASSNGTALVASNLVTLNAGDLPPGGVVRLSLVTLPDSPGAVSCTANATSASVDPDYSDNRASQFVSIGFHSEIDVVNRLHLQANNLVYDAGRNRLWATISPEADLPLARSLVWIEPTTGLISAPVPLQGNSVPRCMAISGNGRYLYLAFSDTPEVDRIDLDNQFEQQRIPLDFEGSSYSYPANDIEPLAGDGTSFLVAQLYSGVSAFDGLLRRTNRLYNSALGLARTTDPAKFIIYDSYELRLITLGASGVSGLPSAYRPPSWADQVEADGNLLLTSGGYLVNSSNLTLVANLGLLGSPCVDSPNQRAYLLNGKTLHAFDTFSPFAEHALELPVTFDNYSSKLCLRWGLDGFAILSDTNIYILRWSSAIPSATDSDRDHLSDAWEAGWFSTLAADPGGDDDGDGLRNFQEYLFGTSPLAASGNPLHVSAMTDAGTTSIHLVFPRRVGIPTGTYGFEISSDLASWGAASNVVETVLSTQTVGGVQMQTVEAVIPGINPGASLVRFRWFQP